MFQSQFKFQEEAHKVTTDSLARIEAQTMKTNGSVADINKWRERANGAYMASSIFVMVIIVPILSWAVWTLVNLPRTVQRSVDSALSAYDITK